MESKKTISVTEDVWEKISTLGVKWKQSRSTVIDWLFRFHFDAISKKEERKNKRKK